MSNSPPLKIFYRPEQTVRGMVSLSPSAGKPEAVVELFQKTGRVEVVGSWTPLSPKEISIAHDPQFVAEVLQCKRRNGFGDFNPALAASLPYTLGSFYHAAKHAIDNKTVAMSPTSGFHHAGYRTSEGFCTFNGLMVAAFLLWKEKKVKRVGIIDLDAHFGNGTEDILDNFKNSRNVVRHYTFGAEVEGKGKYSSRGDYFDAEEWLDGIGPLMRALYHDCDVLFFQAGADPHVEDPLGGYLTTEQMLSRDRAVFEVAREMNLPVVWNLAGGYQRPVSKVLDLHRNTLDACLSRYLQAR